MLLMSVSSVEHSRNSKTLLLILSLHALSFLLPVCEVMIKNHKTSYQHSYQDVCLRKYFSHCRWWMVKAALGKPSTEKNENILVFYQYWEYPPTNKFPFFSWRKNILSKPQPNLNTTVGFYMKMTLQTPPHPPPTHRNFSCTSRRARELKFGTDTH